MYYIIILLVILLDQAVKLLVRARLQLKDTHPVIEDLFHITYYQNPGGAFSILEEYTALLILFPALLSVAIVVFIHMKRHVEPVPVLVALSLIAGGGFGNLIDRITVVDRVLSLFGGGDGRIESLPFGVVVDFIDFGVFPIFNIADICVCTGCGLLLLAVIWPARFGGSRIFGMETGGIGSDVENG